jgi:Glycine rich protein
LHMRFSSIARYGLCFFSAVGLLAGCGGNAGIGAPGLSGIGREIRPQQKGKTFFFSANAQSFTVPANVHSINVVVRGAAGALGCPHSARGARVYAVIPVRPHEKLIVYVGGQGSGSTGGFNGGGNGGGVYGGGGGGGASDVRVSPGGIRDRILVAGGGGSQGGDNFTISSQDSGCGGDGGLVGGRGGDGFDYGGAGQGGTGGTQSVGGTGGAGGGKGSGCRQSGQPGRPGARGAGGSGGKQRSAGGGGGGGGGYFGGGGGGSACRSHDNNGGGGGGGGSSFAERKAMNVHFWKGWKNATTDGLVVFSWQ